jgi:hypothetical protein
MLFFRSEDSLRTWCRQHGHSMGPIVSIDQLWRMATTWYATRLHADSRRPGPDEIRLIFAGLGLQGDFWDPGADSFS